MVSVCVPVYRSHATPNVATLAAALPAALGGREGELVVALNGITAAAAGVPDGAVTVPLPVNRGVSSGWNAAAGAASGDVLVFANDDVVLGAGALERLAAALEERDDAGVVGPVGSMWDRLEWQHASFVQPDSGMEPCDVVSGFLFAARREVYDAVGGFDEAYAPASWEEVDFDMAVEAHGLRCYAVGGVDVTHEWGISARQPPWRMVRWGGKRELLWSIHRRNRAHFLSKWGTTS